MPQESVVLQDAEESEDIKAYRRKIQSGKRGSHHLYTALLGMEGLETEQLLKRIEEGFSYRMLERLQRNIGLSTRQMAKLAGIPDRTLSRRREEGRLHPDESDRLLRTSRVFGRTLDLFNGDASAARRWLSTPQLALGRKIPLDMATTDLGAREVENLIGRLEHGVFV